MSPRRRYANAPIIEAIIDFRIVPPESFDAGSLRLLTIPGYSPALNVDNVTMGVNLDDTSTTPQFLSGREPTGARFTSNGNDRIAVFTKEGFSYSHLPPYTSWDTFRSEARNLWQIYTDNVPSTSVVRIAVRTVNRITLPKGNINLEEFFHTYPKTPTSDYFMMVSFFQQCQLDLNHKLSQTLATLSLAGAPRSNSDNPEVILDIDVFCNKKFSAKGEEAWIALDDIRLIKDDVFESCITDRIREIIS